MSSPCCRHESMSNPPVTWNSSATVPQKSALCLVKSQLFNGYTMLHPNCSTLTSHVWLNLAISSLHQHQLRRPAKGGRRASQVRPGKVGSFATHSVELDRGKTGELEEGPKAENLMPPTFLSASKFSPSGKQRHRRSERSTWSLRCLPTRLAGPWQDGALSHNRTYPKEIEVCVLPKSGNEIWHWEQ